MPARPTLPNRPTRAPDLSLRVDELRRLLRERNPEALANATGAVYKPTYSEEGIFHLLFWLRETELNFPEMIGRDGSTQEVLNPAQQALLAYYFQNADGFPLTSRWISFSELPDGQFYHRAFQGYTGEELARTFGNDQSRFEHACQAAGASRLEAGLGQAAYLYNVLPRVAVLLVYWLGDEDFPATCQLLFDAAARHYLPTDAYAVLGSMLTRTLLATQRTDS